jgi:hypothetical protein
MEKYNQSTDDFFRNVLKDHTVIPSEAAKSAFLKEAATLVNNKKSGKRWFLLFVSGLVIILSGIGVYMAMNTSHEKSIQANALISSSSAKPVISSSLNYTAHNISSSPDKSLKHAAKTINTSSSSGPKPSTIALNHKIENKPKSNSIISRKYDEPKQDLTPVIRKEELPIADLPKNDNQKLPVITEQPITLYENKVSSPILPDTLLKLKNPGVDSTVKIEQPVPNKKSKPGKSDRKYQISTGIYYLPEWLFNIIDDNKFVNSFGVEGTFTFGKYSVRTGAGLSITKGTNELSISYNDFLGNFSKLDSMTFKWNEQHSNIVPTYFLSNKNVYDSLMKLDNARIVKRYTYLQVPLILGYDFWKNDNFAIGLRAGPIFSVLLVTKQISDNYDPGKNKIILINQISPDRIQTNWQIMGGINATFNFSKRLGIELEPEVKYYFNSVYEKSDNTKKPWSAGFRVAFHFNY